MAQIQNTIQNRKLKHLSPFERGKIAALHKKGHSNREIARRLGRVHQTIANELKLRTTIQVKTGRKPYTAYFPETNQAVYEQNRINCGAKSKLLIAIEFINFACEKITNHGWSPDAVVGFSIRQIGCKGKPLVSAKTLYNYIDLVLLKVRNIDLPMKTKWNTKTKLLRKHRRVLGTGIAERPSKIEDRKEFGHWEIDTIEGQKSNDNALLTLIERKTRNYYAIKIDYQYPDSVDYSINKLQQDFGELFWQVFKTITFDNGSEFSNLASALKESPMSISPVFMLLMKRGSNERHNGPLRRYIPIGKAISDFSRQATKHLIIYPERFWTINNQQSFLNKN